MNVMLCRNRVRDFSEWKRVFESHAEAHRAAGLRRVHLWHVMNNFDDVFFLFEMGNLEKARAFINTPGAAEAAKQSGVIEGEYHFLEAGQGY